MEVKKSKNISLITIVIIAICSFLCPLAKAEDISDYISYIYIYQILDYGDPTDTEDLMYEFNLEINAFLDVASNMDADVASIEVLTPAGYMFQIPKQPGQWNNNIWTSYEYIEEEVLPGFWIRDASWRYRARFSNQTDLQAYGDGEYTITLHFNNGSQSQTTAWFGVADTTDPVQQPTQEPIIIFPQPNQVVESPVTFSWESCTDLNASGIWIAIEEKTSGDYAEEGFDVDETVWGPVYLSNGEWEIALDFENWSYLFGNDDGIGVFSAKYSRSRYEFTVATPQTNDYEVWGGDTFIHDDYGTIDEDFFLKGYWSVDELISNGYKKLGESDGQTATFSGQYEYYVIATRGQVLLDSIQGSDDSYYSSFEISWSRGNVTDPNNMLGPPDELYATMGMDTCASYFCGYFAFTNPGNWTELTVITITDGDNLNISKTIVNEGPIAPGDIITYRISFDTLDLTDEVTDVFIEDYLPDEVNFVSDNAILGFYDKNEHKYIWISSSLAPGTTRELLLTVQINPDVPVGTEITNYATIDCDEKPATTASFTITVNKEPPLEIEDIQITSGTIIRDDISGDVTISMNLPEGIGQDDIDAEEPIVLNLGDIQIEAYDIDIEEIDDRIRITAVFDTAAVLNAIAGYGQFDVEIIGRLKDGRIFSGQTTITISEAEAVNISDYISKIYFDQFWNYENPTDSNDETYEFYFIISADSDKAYNMNADVSRIEVSTPSDYTFKIQKLPGQWSDNIWTSYEYTPVEGGKATWEYRIIFSDIAGLQDYGDGEYTIILNYNNGSQSQTTAWFGMADNQNPVPQPPEPNITYPLPGKIVESPIACSWESVDDVNVSNIWIGLEEKTNGGFKEEDFDVNETSWEPIYLTNGKWEVAIIFENSSVISNRDDGIEIESYKFSQSRYDFKVINYLTNTYEVWGGKIPIDSQDGSYGSIADMNEYGYEKLIVDPNDPGNFPGEYNYYVIATQGEFLLDSIQGSDGSYLSSKDIAHHHTANITDSNNIYGAPDGLCTTIGDNNPLDDYSGWLVLENPGGWKGITVITRKLNISKKAVNTPEELENISPGDMITYNISLDTIELLYDVNNVIIVDYLPDEVSPADINKVDGFYDENEHTFTWFMPLLEWNSVNELLLTVEVNKGVAPDTIITNFVTIDSNETPATVASASVTVSKDQQREIENMQINPDTISRHGIDVSGVMVILEMPPDISEEEILIKEPLVLSLDSEDSGVPVPANDDQDIVPYEGVLYVVAVFDKTQLLNAILSNGPKEIKVEGKLTEGSFIGRDTLTIN